MDHITRKILAMGLVLLISIQMVPTLLEESVLDPHVAVPGYEHRTNLSAETHSIGEDVTMAIKNEVALDSDGFPDQTVYEGETVFFNGTVNKTLPEVNKTSPNIRVNDVDITEGWGGWSGPALDDNGTVYVTWMDTRSGKDIYFDKAVRYGVFGQDVLMDDDPPGSPSYNDIALGVDGGIHAVWEVGSYGPRYAISTDGGQTFSSPIRISDDGAPGGTFVRMDTGPDDSIHVVWGTGEVRYRFSPDEGRNWKPGQILGDGDFPDVAVANNGSVYVVWSEMVPGSGHEIFFTWKEPGGSFAIPATVHPPTAWVRQSQSIAVGENGEILITWKEAGLPGVGEQKIICARSVDGGSTFETPSVIRSVKTANEPHIFLQNPVIAAFGQAGYAVAWPENWDLWPQDTGMMVSVSLDGGETFGPLSRVDDNSSQKRAPRIAGNAEGDLFATWHDARNQPPGVLHGSEVYGVWLNVSAAPMPVSYEWDFDATVDSDGDGNYTNDVDARGQTPTFVYDDDGSYTVTMNVVNDEGETESDSCVVMVLNRPPTVELEVLPKDVGISLRVAGEKWHDVSVELYEDDVLIASGSITRYPGSPNDQMLRISDLRIDILKTYSATVRYTPEDDATNGQSNGATPIWIELGFGDGSDVGLYHTFNVRQPDTYVWEAGLTQSILSHGLAFMGTAYDPGSDDLTFDWDFGDGATITNFFPNLDNAFPVEATDTVTHTFTSSGTYIITLTAEDDDGGTGVATITIVIP